MPNASNRKGDRLNLHRFGEVQLVRTVTVRHSCISWAGRYISPSGVWGAARAARVGATLTLCVCPTPELGRHPPWLSEEIMPRNFVVPCVRPCCGWICDSMQVMAIFPTESSNTIRGCCVRVAVVCRKHYS